MTNANTLFEQDANLEAVNAVAANTDDELAALLAEIDEPEAVEAEAEADELAELLADDLEEEVEKTLAKLEVKEVKAAAEAKKAAVKAAKKEAAGDEAEAEAKPVKKRATRSGTTADMKKSEAAIHKLGASRYETLILDNEMVAMSEDDRKKAIDDFVAGFDNLAKKVGEKALNLSMALNNSESLSVYTQMAIKLLKEKGEMSTADLREAYLARPYSPGTASAQGSQMFMLLPYFKIATRVGNSLKLNPDSVLAELF